MKRKQNFYPHDLIQWMWVLKGAGDSMRRSKKEAAETRRHIVETAATEFRKNGIDGIGYAGLMAAAGLTHGGFYKHFESKEQVVEEALALAAESMFETAKHATSSSSGHRGLQALLSQYLSAEHRDEAAKGCPYAALGCEVARSNTRVREAMTAGLLKTVDLIANQIEGMPPAAAKKQALWMFSAMIGALTMARMVSDPDLSASILRETLLHIGRSSVSPAALTRDGIHSQRQPSRKRAAATASGGRRMLNP